MNADYAYGMWVLVAFNAGLFYYFVRRWLAPASKREWRSLGAFAGFILALFTEMYGFPLTIYLLSSYVGQLPFAEPFSHKSGNLWASLVLGGQWSWVFMLFGSALMAAGFVLLAKGWKRIHAGRGALVTEGVYSRIRHPQYAGLMVLIAGALVQWPTLVTLLMAPVLLLLYYRLARKEEWELEVKFGWAYQEYRNRVPAFIPKAEKELGKKKGEQNEASRI